jgi:hypothetical protein
MFYQSTSPTVPSPRTVTVPLAGIDRIEPLAACVSAYHYRGRGAVQLATARRIVIDSTRSSADLPRDGLETP